MGDYKVVRPIRHTFATFNFLALAVLGVPFAVSQAQQRDGAAAIEKLPSFEVASVKPSRPGESNHDWDSNSDRVTIENYCLRDLIASAYDLKSDSQVLGGPNWLDNKHFDIAAKVDDVELAKLKTMTGNDTRNEWNQMMQSLLADRFGLKVRRDQRTIPVYTLVVAKSGQKLALATAKETNHSLSGDNSHLTATAISMASFANYLTHMNEAEDRVVIDRTRLTGDFNFKLDWTRDRGNDILPDAQYPGLFTALREQLGLELKPDKAPVDVVVVESAKEPEFD
jgi:uncharacterized protein (TIGR03435 family)